MIVNFLMYYQLLNSLIPISLFVAMEITKFIQADMIMNKGTSRDRRFISRHPSVRMTDGANVRPIMGVASLHNLRLIEPD